MVYLKAPRWTYIVLASTCLSACTVHNSQPADVSVASAYVQPAEYPVAYQGTVLKSAKTSPSQSISMYRGQVGASSQSLIHKGHISMRRQKAYMPPPTPEALESRIDRVVSRRLTDTEHRLRQYSDQQVAATEKELSALEQRNQVKMRQIAAKTLTDSEDFIRALARDTVLSEDDQIKAVISKVAEDTVINADQNLAEAIRKVARQAVVEGDESVMAAIRQQAKKTMLNGDADIEKAIQRVAKKTVVESDDQIDNAIRRVARSTVVEADPQVMNAIRKVVNLAVLESDEPVEYTVRRIIEDRFKEIKDDPIALAVRDVTKDAIRDEAERVSADTKDYTRLQLALNEAKQQVALQKTQSALVGAVERARDGDEALRQDFKLSQDQQAQKAAELKSYAEKLALQQKLALLQAEHKQEQRNTHLQQQVKSYAEDLAQKQQIALLEAQHKQDLENQHLRVYTEQAVANQKESNQLLKEKLELMTQLAEARVKAYADKQVADVKDYADEIAQTEALAAEHRLRDYAATQLTLLEDRTMDTVLGAMATTEADLTQAAAQKAQDVTERLIAYTDRKAQDILHKSNATIQEVTQATRLTDDEIRAVAESTLADASEEIRALALQTLAQSDDYIRTVAREAVTSKDPSMQNALASAARQVILDENNEVAFAIRRVVDDAVDKKADDLVAHASSLIKTDAHPDLVSENIDATDLKVASLQEPGVITTDLDDASETNAHLRKPKFRQDWMNIRGYHLVLHEDNASLDKLLRRVLKRAEPFVGPWTLKWKLSKENMDILQERFSLDAETTFEDFANYLAQYMMNTRGILLNFNMFDAERILVVSDE